MMQPILPNNNEITPLDIKIFYYAVAIIIGTIIFFYFIPLNI